MFLSIILTIIICVILVKYLNKKYLILSLCKRVQTTNGTPLKDKVAIMPGKTIFGNNFDMWNMTPVKLFEFARSCYTYAAGKSYLLHFLWTPVYCITNVEDAEPVFQSQTLTTKSIYYNLLHPFLGESTLISSGNKWHSRRKMLTATFHFNILESFMEIFKEESYKLIEKLNTKSGQDVCLSDIVPELALNIICQTALGVKLKGNDEDVEYRKNVSHIEDVIVKRLLNPFQYCNILYYLSGDYFRNRKYLNVVHSFTNKIIEKRRQEFQNQKCAELVDEFGRKKHYAMLDTLLIAEANGHIDHQGIVNEVSTFMLQGYHATSACLIFTLLNLALQQDIQEKCYQELEEIDDISNLNVFDFNHLKYLDCIIKETLRLHPPVAFIGRHCTEETTNINDLILPKNTQIILHLYDILRDPKYFPQPDKFNPERFNTENNSSNQHAFTFVPFSAGPRNCIGQKFAMLEVKVVVAAIIKHFKLLPATTQLEDLTYGSALIIRTKEKIFIKLVPDMYDKSLLLVCNIYLIFLSKIVQKNYFKKIVQINSQ